MSDDRIHPAAGVGFEVAVEHYERGRPTYPDDAVTYLVRELAIAEGRDVAELGAGTGKFTELIVHTGARITGVEPVPAMRAALERNCPTIRVVDGTAESIPAEDEAFDTVLAASAFHWFDGDRAAAELHRVLCPGAGLVALWLESDRVAPWGDEVLALLEPLWQRTSHPSLVERRRGEPLERHGGFAPVRRVEVAFDDAVDRDGTLAWFASFSVVGALPAGERTELMERLAAILDHHGVTTVQRTWRADLWVTRRV